MKTQIENYRTIKGIIDEEFAINSPEGAFVSNHLWTLPDNWIEGIAKFIKEFKSSQSNGWICCNVLHDIGGFVNKELGFSPRCFKGGNVWDNKTKKAQVRKFSQNQFIHIEK